MMTGTRSPARSLVASLNALQNCGMLVPAEARAGPGLEPPAGNCSLQTFATFLLTRHTSYKYDVLCSGYERLLVLPRSHAHMHSVFILSCLLCEIKLKSHFSHHPEVKK